MKAPITAWRKTRNNCKRKSYSRLKDSRLNTNHFQLLKKKCYTCTWISSTTFSYNCAYYWHLVWYRISTHMWLTRFKNCNYIMLYKYKVSVTIFSLPDCYLISFQKKRVSEELIRVKNSCKNINILHVCSM